MATEIGWKFPSNGGGQVVGFNDSGIETFAGQPFESLAREIIQNSLDARALGHEPVTVSFRLKVIRLADFPAHDEMLNIVAKCLTASQDDPKAEEFFENAKKILKGKYINCLEILDSNTTGLQDGENRKSGQWDRLIKATGKPQTQALAGGSFGIGKNAPFAVSDLRTVFYSTRYRANGNTAEYAQGKAILVSHELANGEDTQPVGYYGVQDGCDRLAGRQIPAILKRRKNEMDGTTILIPGMREVKDWEKKIVAAVISNFFFAIDQKDLVVMVESAGGPLPIDHDSLPILLGHTKPPKKTSKATQKSLHALSTNRDVEIACAYYHAIKKSKPVETEQDILGHCSLWIAKELYFPQSVAISRRGMKITDNLPGLRGWGGCADFAAVCMCASNAGNELLRGMENPAHDAFEPARLGKNSADGEKALKKLATWIRNEIKKITEKSVAKPVLLDAMREFFPSEDDDDFSGENSERDFDGRSEISLKPIRPTRALPGTNTSNGDDDGEDDDPENGGGGGRGGGRGGRGGGGGRTTVAMDIEAVRILRANSDNVKHVNFTPKQTGKGVLSLQIAGDSFTEKVQIKNISGAGVKKEGNQFVLNVREGKRVSVQIELSESIDESLSVILAKEQKQ